MPMSSKGTKIYLSGPLEAFTITAVSKAAPAVLTTSGVPAVGDFVSVNGTGFASIDGQMWEVEAVAAGTVTLKGSDTSTEPGAATATGKMTMASSALVEICVASLNRESPAASTLDVTTLCDAERQQMTGMKNNGTWTAQGFYEPESAGQIALRAAYDDGLPRLMMVEPPDHSRIVYQTQVNSLSESFAVDQPVQISASGIVMGKVSYLAPAAMMAAA
jgi:hypothetical protein